MDDKVNLNNLDSYAESCRQIANKHFAGLNLEEAAEKIDDYNAYPNLERLSAPRNLTVLEDRVNDRARDQARRAVLDGLIFWEHTAAGEATRLKLGPKYLIHPHRVRLGYDYLADGLREPAQFAGADAADWTRFEGILRQSQKLQPLTLGGRHMCQWAFEMQKLADEYGLPAQEVMRRQKALLVVNEQSRDEICEHILKLKFLGLAPENFLFMAQPSFRGLSPTAEGWRYDESTPRRLHNHGQMAMQKTMDRQIFHLDLDGNYHYLNREDFFYRLDSTADLVSYNIEDLGYLTKALDFDTIALALALGQEGYGMSMEIVANNPEHPIKGGLCAYDPKLGRDVVVESFRLRGLAPERITHLNKNFNHYPSPAKVFKRLHQEGLFMPADIKGVGAIEAPARPRGIGHHRNCGGALPRLGQGVGLYFQPVQGDMNFLVKTAFISRRYQTSIKSWKSPDDTPAALETMRLQDAQPGFVDFVKQL